MCNRMRRVEFKWGSFWTIAVHPRGFVCPVHRCNTPGGQLLGRSDDRRTRRGGHRAGIHYEQCDRVAVGAGSATPPWNVGVRDTQLLDRWIGKSPFPRDLTALMVA